MRILTRRVGESLCVGDGIKIFILDIQGVFARIGVTAPDGTVVCNEESFETHEWTAQIYSPGRNEGVSR